MSLIILNVSNIKCNFPIQDIVGTKAVTLIRGVSSSQVFNLKSLLYNN